jgi:O-antigen/teichoic acid export membrane protein
MMNVKSLLFENKGIRQTIFKNTFWLGLGAMVSKLFSLILLIYVARILGAEEYGKFNFALAFAGFFTVIHDFGIPQIIIREFAKEDADKKEFYSIISLDILMSIVVFAFLILSSLIINDADGVRKTIIIIGAANLISNFSNIFTAMFQAKAKMEFRTWIDVLKAVLLFAAGLLIIFSIPSSANLSLAYLFSAVVSLPFIMIFFSRKFFNIKVLWDRKVWKKFLLISWPLALVGMFGVLYNYIDSIMMGLWGLMTETGWYNAAVRIITGAALPSVLISKSAYPLLSKFHQSKQELQKTLNHQIGIMVMLALPIFTGGIVLAPRIIHAFYPNNFFPAILAFQILMISLVFIYMARPFADLAVAINQQKKFFFITTIGVAVNIILNLYLIPKYSFYGAAAATSTTSVLSLIIYMLFVKFYTKIKFIDKDFWAILASSAVCSLLMYLFIEQPFIYNLNVFISISTGALIYLFLFYEIKHNLPIWLHIKK